MPTTQTQHTPGPWTIDDARISDETTADGIVISGANGDVVAIVPEDESKIGSVNARRIAAAPEMHDALRTVLRYLDPETAIWREIRAVIAKAEGKS